MPKRSTFDEEFAREVCSRINRYIEENGISDADAARALGVRKQMIGPYRKGDSVPGSQILARACVEWGIAFQYRGFELSARSLTASKAPHPVVVETQLPLPFEKLVSFRGVSERFRDVELAIRLRKVS